MSKLAIRISVPVMGSLNPLVKTALFLADYHTNDNIYEKISSIVTPDTMSTLKTSSPPTVYKLKEIINLHNVSGIQSIPRIETMIGAIAHDKHIYNEAGLPNVKVALIEKNQLLVFNGHHSLVAYIIEGYKHLHQIPYIMISRYENGSLVPLTDGDIYGFYIEWKDIRPNWRTKTINWQALKQSQIEPRNQKNMGELADCVKKRLKVSVKSGIFI